MAVSFAAVPIAVVVNGLWQYCGYAAWRTLAGNTPYVVFTHGMLDPYFKHAFPLKHIKKWLYWVPAEYRVLRDAYRVLPERVLRVVTLQGHEKR